MIRKVLLLLSGNAFGSMMLLIRNLMVARMISVENYGIAATFAVSMAVVEMASGLGLQQLIIQAREGDDPRLQAGLQGFNVLRGVFSGLVLFALAHPIARFLNIEDVAWAYQVMALVPVLRGLEHFDIYRLNREMNFRPLILTKILPAVISLASLWPLYQMAQDYRIMLYAILIQWGLTLVTSHLTARRRYVLRFDRDVMGRAFSFGWPILVSNVLLFLVLQGDKLIIGRALGMENLAIYAMGLTLTLTPTLVMAGTLQPFFLPQLSKANDRPEAFERLAMTVMQTALASGLLLIVAVLLAGPAFIDLVLGPKYAPLHQLIIWLAIAYAIRMARVGCTITALSQAYSSNAMIANLFRILALPASWFIVQSGGTLVHVAWAGIAGEIAAYIAAFTLARYRTRISVWPMILPIAAMAAILLMASAFTGNMQARHGPAGIAFLVAAALSLYGMGDLRRFFGHNLRGNKADGP